MAGPQTALAQSPATVHCAPALMPPTHTFTSFAETFVPAGADDEVLVVVIRMSTRSPGCMVTGFGGCNAVGHVVPALGKIGNDALAWHPNVTAYDTGANPSTNASSVPPPTIPMMRMFSPRRHGLNRQHSS